MVLVTKIASESPWQNGLVERDGGLWKEVFLKGFEDCQPRNKEEVNDLCDRTNQAKNSMPRKSGFSPYQHVFFSDLRIPRPKNCVIL
jgi:IS30 family transposase